MCVLIHFSEKWVSVDYAINCFINCGGNRRSFLNTWEYQLVLLIAFLVRLNRLLNIHCVKEKRNIKPLAKDSENKVLISLTWPLHSKRAEPLILAACMFLFIHFHVRESKASGRPATLVPAPLCVCVCVCVCVFAQRLNCVNGSWTWTSSISEVKVTGKTEH
jgi:hypothetical protein